MTAKLTLGPILFHWEAEKKLDFYARIADEAPIDTVYLGETICSKRAPYFEKHYDEVTERLEKGGKKVVYSSLSEIMTKRERQMLQGLCEIEDHEVEVNNTSGLIDISGRPHRIGPLMNVYNEETLEYLAGLGATHFGLPIELPGKSVKILAAKANELGLATEVQVFGRASLAVSARCYHARAHGRIKDNCQFVCEEDPDGMPLTTLDGKDFLSINGIQTLSNSYLNMLGELREMQDMGVNHFRLSPHTQDMVEIASIFRDRLDGKIDVDESNSRMSAIEFPAPFANGFWYGKPGHSAIAS